MLGTEGEDLHFVVTSFQKPFFPPGTGSHWRTFVQEAEKARDTNSV